MFAVLLALVIDAKEWLFLATFLKSRTSQIAR